MRTQTKSTRARGHSAVLWSTLWNRLPGTLLNAEDIVFLAAADFFFFNSLVTYPPHSSLPSHSCISLLTVPSTLPFSTMFPQGQWACGCLNGVKLCYPSILRSWWALLDMLTLSETLLAYMSMVRAQIILIVFLYIKKRLKTVTLCG